MKINPMRDLVLIKADEAQNKTKTGLLISEDWRSLPLTGEVVEVGPLVHHIQKGDKVAFERFSSLILDDEQRLCPERLVFGVIA